MSASLRDLGVLVIDDDRQLQGRLEEALAGEVAEVRTCGSVAEAREILRAWTPRVLILDFVLSDGTAFDVLKELDQREPAPSVVVISGSARPVESFKLSRMGVHTYISKPFGVDELLEAIEQALTTPIDLRPLLRDTVGKRPLHEVQDEVRDTMLDEALARGQGARKAAARLLEVSRQVVQYMLRNRG